MSSQPQIDLESLQQTRIDACRTVFGCDEVSAMMRANAIPSFETGKHGYGISLCIKGRTPFVAVEYFPSSKVKGGWWVKRIDRYMVSCIDRAVSDLGVIAMICKAREETKETAWHWSYKDHDGYDDCPFDLSDGSRPRERSGFVYFILAKEVSRIKIGYADCVQSRLDTLQTGSPCKLTLLGVMEGTVKDERRLHKRFRALRFAGEWFTASPELLRFIKESSI